MLDQALEYLALSSADRQELGFGSGMTCWRRLRDWQADGIWERLHLALLTRLREHDQIDWTRAASTGRQWPAPGGPTDRPEPYGPRQTRQQTPSHRRPARCPVGTGRHRSLACAQRTLIIPTRIH